MRSSKYVVFKSFLITTAQGVVIKLPMGIDISHWEWVEEFGLINPRPALVIAKATEGTTYTDPDYQHNYTGCYAENIPFGAYHFFRKAYSSIDQANHFLFVIRGFVSSKTILVLDLEEYGISAAMIISWMNVVRSVYPNNLIMIYSRAEILNGIGMTSSQQDILGDIPIWTAGYPNNPDQYDSPPSSYIPDQTRWGPVWMWQYSESAIVSGVSGGGCDLDWLSIEMLEWLGQSPPPPDPEPIPENGGTMIFSNGVEVIEAQYLGLDTRIVKIPPFAIKKATFELVTGCGLAQNIQGDIVYNFTPFTNCKPNLGLKIGGTVYHSYVPYDPFITWSGGTPLIDHPEKIWNQKSDASQAWRYLIEDGVKNPRYNADWDKRAARRAIGYDAGGNTFLISVKGGTSAQNTGLSLHELVDLIGLPNKLVMMVDGDSGSSTQDVLRMTSGDKLFTGTDNPSPVAVFGVINLVTPLDNPNAPPPDTGVHPIRAIYETSDGAVWESTDFTRIA